jgi:hypothetical protein
MADIIIRMKGPDFAHVPGSEVPPQTGSDTPDYPDPLIGVTLNGGRTIVPATPATLQAKLDAAQAGETIELDAGTYSSDYIMDSSAPANNPVILKGAANFTSVFTNRLQLLGARNIATGLMFNGTSARVRLAGTNCKFIGNKMTGRKGNMIGPWEANPGSHCEVAYNEFYEPGDWNFTYPPTEFRMALRFTTSNSFSSVHTDGWIHHNYVHDFPDKPAAGYHTGQSDAFELGEDAYSWNQTPWNWWFEDNVIQRHLQSGQSSVIDMKCAGVVCRRNTALDSTNITCQGRLGGQQIIEGNYVGGILAFSGDVVIAGNRVDSNLVSGAGDCAYNFTHVNDPSLDRQQSLRHIYTGNSGLIELGKWPTGDNTFRAQDTLIENHTGSVSEIYTSGTTNNSGGPSTAHDIDWLGLTGWQNYASALSGPLTTVSDVGPDAIANASAAYKAARGL